MQEQEPYQGVKTEREVKYGPADRHLLPSGRIRQLSAKYGYDPAAMVTGIFTPGLMTSALAAHTRGPLAAALRHYDPREVIARLMQQAPPEQVGLVNTLRYIDFKHTLPGDVLVKVDRACMSVALEVRPVYLHRDMLQLAGAIPGAQLAGRKHTKEALKVALECWLPAGCCFRLCSPRRRGPRAPSCSSRSAFSW